MPYVTTQTVADAAHGYMQGPVQSLRSHNFGKQTPELKTLLLHVSCVSGIFLSNSYSSYIQLLHTAPLKIAACSLKSVSVIRNNNILCNILCLEDCAVRFSSRGADERLFTFIYFLHACAHSAFWESLSRKLFFPEQLAAFDCPFCSVGAVNCVFVSVAYYLFLLN